MLPLALGTGPGAEERRSIAVVVIGGQTLSLLLTLIATPVVYSLLDDLRHTARWRKLASALSGVRERAFGIRGRLAGSRTSNVEDHIDDVVGAQGGPEDEREQVRAGAGGD
jgi:HAE1 family hydrophobic/amphiphilic exporter-1